MAAASWPSGSVPRSSVWCTATMRRCASTFRNISPETLHHEYSVLSKLFSEETGTTVERCYIAQRIERVKELLSYGELSLSEIADRMNYSSVAHLSAQFKQVTGLTPSRYRQLAQPPRRPLDKL